MKLSWVTGAGHHLCNFLIDRTACCNDATPMDQLAHVDQGHKHLGCPLPYSSSIHIGRMLFVRRRIQHPSHSCPYQKIHPTYTPHRNGLIACWEREYSEVRTSIAMVDRPINPLTSHEVLLLDGSIHDHSIDLVGGDQAASR